MMHLLMIVHDLDIARAARPFRPLETDSPLIIDADAVLTFSIAFQRFKSVSRQIQVPRRSRCVELIEV